jgi:hypothetical protein
LCSVQEQWIQQEQEQVQHPTDLLQHNLLVQGVPLLEQGLVPVEQREAEHPTDPQQ